MSNAASQVSDSTRDMIEKLLVERQELLVMFCRLTGLRPVGDEGHAQLLQHFCQVLVDYSAFGHFEILERIADGHDQAESVVALARQLYPTIAQSSEVAVAFNDKYDASDHELDLHRLDQDLGDLGEALAVRFEMEDRIIEALLQA